MLRKGSVSRGYICEKFDPLRGDSERKRRHRMVTWVKVRGALNVFMDHGHRATKNS